MPARNIASYRLPQPRLPTAYPPPIVGGPLEKANFRFANPVGRLFDPRVERVPSVRSTSHSFGAPLRRPRANQRLEAGSYKYVGGVVASRGPVRWDGDGREGAAGQASSACHLHEDGCEARAGAAAIAREALIVAREVTPGEWGVEHVEGSGHRRRRDPRVDAVGVA